MVADQVLCDFISAFPEGKEKKGMKRGNVCLTQYIHDHGTRKSRKDIGAKQILDRELFVTKMEIARKLNPQRCLDEWSKLEADPLNHYDSNGPPWAPLRLRIPGWLLGSEYEAEETENYEQKALRSSSKIEKNMNQESREQILGEVSKGFGHVQPVQQSAAAPLPPTAWTLEGSSGSETAKDLVKEVLKHRGVDPTFDHLCTDNCLLGYCCKETKRVGLGPLLGIVYH